MPPPTRATTHAAYLLALVLLGAAVFVLARGEAGARAGQERLAKTLTSVNERALELEKRSLVALEAAEREDLLGGESQVAAAEEALADARHALYLSEYQRGTYATALGRLDLAFEALEGAAKEERGWEWHYEDRRLRAMVESLPAHESEVSVLAAGPHGQVLYSGTEDGSVWAHSAAIGSESSMILEHRQPRAVLDEAVTALCAIDLSDGSGPGGQTGLVVASGTGALVWMPARTGSAWARTDLDVRVTALAGFRTEEHGALVFAGCVDGKIYLWTPREEELVVFSEHDDTVNALQVSPDGTLLASASDDQRVQVTPIAETSTESRAETRMFFNHTDWVRAVAFDAQGQRLATGGDDGKLVIIDLTTDDEEVIFHNLDAALVHVAFDAEGVPMAVTDGGVVVRADNRRWTTLPMDEDGIVISAAAGFPTERKSEATQHESWWIAIADGGNTPTLLTEKRPGQHSTFSRSIGEGIRALALSGDGSLLAAGATKGDVHLLGRPNGAWPSDVLAGHSRLVRALCFSPDETRLASGDSEGRVLVWDVAEARELFRLESSERVDALAFLEGSNQLLVIGTSGRASLHDLESGEMLRESPAASGFVFRSLSSPDGKRHGWVGDAGTIRVWSALDGERLAALRLRGVGQVEDAVLPVRGPHLVLISNTTAAVVLDLERGEERARVFDGEHGFRCVAISDDGERFATGSGNGRVRVHDARTGTLLQTVWLDRNPVLALAFSGDGQRLAVGTSRGLVEVR